MTTATSRRTWDLARAVELHDSGLSYEKIRVEMGLDVTVQAVGKALRDWRHEHQVGPPPHVTDRHLPWDLTGFEWAHHDFTGAGCHLVARQARNHTLSRDLKQRLARFLDYLTAQGDDTVVWFNPRAKSGKGGWVYRQREGSEVTWYGMMIP